MTLYRKPGPYRKPQTYRGAETAVPVVAPAIFGTRGMPWREGKDHAARTAFPWQVAGKYAHAIATPWERLQALRFALRTAWQQAATHGLEYAMPYGKADTYYAQSRHPWQQATPHETRTGTPWEQFSQKLSERIGLPWIVPDAHQFNAAMRWGTLAKHSMRRSLVWRQLKKLGAHIALPWGRGHHYQEGYGQPWHAPPDDGGPGGTSTLQFPDLPVYLMIPTLTGVVIGTGADLKLLSVQITGDVDSFDWSFQGQIPAETAPLVDPRVNSEPVAIRVTVNGYVWSFIVDSISKAARWSQAKTLTIRGGSRSRLLAGPWAPQRTLLQADPFNASQLADHELESTGWTSLWDAGADWEVPGGTWSYQDLEPIAAMQKLAAAVGATLETDADALNIRTRPRYPIKPWAWDDADPYAIIPVNAIDALDGDWQGGNNANGIFVFPQNATSGAFVRITGTDGASLVRMVVDPLLTDAGAQQQRGIQEIAGAGRKHREALNLPLLPAPSLPGLIPLRELLECTDEQGNAWRGQVMGIQITGQRGNGLSVRQVLTIERQFRE